jgi:hypothetical protein
MKRTLLLFCLTMSIIYTSSAQKNSYGISVGIGGGLILKRTLIGAAAYDLKTGYSIGFKYSRSFTDKLSLQSGLNFYSNTVLITPSFDPDFPNETREHKLAMLYVPISLRKDLSKYFFMNAGLIGNIDISNKKQITNQTGIGAMIGIGTEISINDNFSIQLNPYLNFLGLLQFSGENYPERVLDAGIKLSFILK